MDLTKLNMLYMEHRHAPTDATFADLYAEAAKLFRKRNRAAIVRSGYGDENDADTVFNDAVLALAAKSVINFGKALSRTLSNRQRNYYRDEQRRLNHYDRYETIGPQDNDSDSPTSAIEPQTYDDYEFTRKKNTEDQLQLVFRILESAKILFDPTTVAAVEGPGSDSITVAAVNGILSGANAFSIAKSLGLQRNTIERRILRLGRYLPEGCDVREHLPDGYSVKREYISA